MKQLCDFPFTGTRRSCATTASVVAALMAVAVAFPLEAACTVTAQMVSFGDYSPLAMSSTDGVGAIAVSCDESTTYTLSLSSGAGSQSERTLVGNGAALAYNLYTNAAHSEIWGDASGGTATVSGTGTAGSHPVYGRIRAGQNVTVGSYADAITVTLDY